MSENNRLWFSDYIVEKMFRDTSGAPVVRKSITFHDVLMVISGMVTRYTLTYPVLRIVNSCMTMENTLFIIEIY